MCAIWNTSEKMNLLFLKESTTPAYSYAFAATASSESSFRSFITATSSSLASLAVSAESSSASALAKRVRKGARCFSSKASL